MGTDRKLIQYLPQFMRDYLEIQKIMEAEQPEVDLAWEATENAFADQFILDATEYGVSRWETILGILPKGTDTLDERKFRILTKQNQELPYTLRKLEQVLTILCGEGGFSIEVNYAQYHILVKLALTNEKNRHEVVDVLQKMLPANMMQTVQIMYNTHRMLAPFTHEQLSAYTHEQLEREVFN